MTTSKVDSRRTIDMLQLVDHLTHIQSHLLYQLRYPEELSVPENVKLMSVEVVELKFSTGSSFPSIALSIDVFTTIGSTIVHVKVSGV